MTYLLDTHTFLWTAFEQSKLSERSRAAILDPGNEVIVSAVSFWELSLKYALGKLELTGAEPGELPTVAASMGFELLPLDADLAASFHRLPREAHRDPFDRMLVWQAISRHMPLITADRHLSEYASQGLVVLW